MSTYYCHYCAVRAGVYAQPGDPSAINLTGSAYTLRKFIEHTVAASGANKTINSIYADPTYDAYRNYYISASLSGSVEVQPDGKKNLVWHAHQSLGPAFKTGSFKFHGETVKVVYAENTGKLHHFHVNAHDYATQICAACGCAVLL